MFVTRSEELPRLKSSSQTDLSEEIECQVGHFLEVIHRRPHPRKFSWHPDTSSTSIQFNFDYGSIFHQKMSSESHDGTSLIMKSELQKVQGTSWPAAVIIMANCTIGMGLLNFPSAVLRAGGILPALLTQLVTLIFIIISLTMMCYLSQYYGDVSYQGIIGSHLGRIPKFICKIFIFINNFGTLVVFLVVIGDQIEHIIRSLQTKDSPQVWYINKKIVVPVVSTILIFPCCLFKSFDIFKYTSFLGVAAAVYVAFGLIMMRYFFPGPTATHYITTQPSSHLLQIIPLICFAYECHIEIPPMVACLKRHDFWYFEKMIFGYVILSSIIYTVSGVFGYLTFGLRTTDDIIMGYAPNDVLVIISLILLSLKIITTYPVVFYCLRIVIEDIIQSHWRMRQSINNHDFLVRFLVSIVLFVSSVILAIFVPTITSVINIIGGVSAIFIFIFPGMCYLRLYSLDKNEWQGKLILLGAFYITFGTFLAGITTTQAIQGYFQN